MNKPHGFVKLLITLFLASLMLVGIFIPAQAAMSESELIADALFNAHETVEVYGRGIKEDNIDAFLQNIYDSNPSLLTGASYGYEASNDGYINEIHFTYPYDADTIKNMYKEYEKAASDALAVLDDDMSDLEKVVALHYYIIARTAYDNEGYKNDDMPLEDFTAYGTLVKRVAVCAGYARALCDLLDRAGIENFYVYSDKMNHAWNMVRLYGEWYHVDATWDDPYYKPENNILEIDDYDFEGMVYHNSLLVSDEGMKKLGYSDWYSDGRVADDTRFDGYFASITSAMCYYNREWYYVSDGDVCSSEIDMERFKLTDNRACQLVAIAEGNIYYTIYNTKEDISELRRVLTSGAGDIAVVTFENKGKSRGSYITELISENGGLKYTVSKLSADPDACVYKTEYFAVTNAVTGIEDGGLYNSDKMIRFQKGAAATLNGKNFESGVYVSENGDYVLEVTDSLGIKAKYRFSIDNVCPEFAGVTHWEHYYPGISASYSEGIATLDGKNYSSGEAVMKPGEHTLKLTDKAGNITTVKIVVNEPDNFMKLADYYSFLCAYFGLDGILTASIVGGSVFILLLLTFLVSRRSAFVSLRKQR